MYVFYVFDVIKTHDASLQLFVLFVNSLMFIKAGSRNYGEDCSPGKYSSNTSGVRKGKPAVGSVVRSVVRSVVNMRKKGVPYFQVTYTHI